MDKKRKTRMLNELVQMAIAVNVHTDYCVFVRFAGHVEQLEFQICKSKKKYNEEIASAYFGYKDAFSINDDAFGDDAEGTYNQLFMNRYNEIKDVLVSILRDGEVDYDLLYAEKRIEYDYKF